MSVVQSSNSTLAFQRIPDNGGEPGAPAQPVTCVAMAVALRFGGTTWLKTLFALGRHISKIPEPMYRLAFIHFLRWTIVEQLPDGKGGKQKLDPACLLFEGDFDGNIFQYVDTFIQAVPFREWAVWNRGFDFPGLRPVARFAKWAHAQNIVPDHYFFAYPQATTKMVRAGVKVAEAVAAFEANADHVADDEEWFRFFERLLAEVQRDI